MPISVWVPAIVPATQGSESWVVPPSQYSNTKPCEAATTPMTEAIRAVVPSPDGVFGSTRSSPATSRYPAAVPRIAMLVMFRPSAVRPPSAKSRHWMISTVETHSAPTHGPTSTTASVPPSR
jgi:hypothetical protein